MGRYGHKSLRCKDFYNFTMAGFGRLRPTDCGSHGRGPRFDPLCVHHSEPLKIGAFCIFGTGLIRQLPVHLGKTRQQQAGENPGTLFRKCFLVLHPLRLGDRRIPFPTTCLGRPFPFQLRLRTLSCSWRRSAGSDAAIRLAAPRSVTRDGRYEVPVQAS
jgi:hypothetical protein